MYQFSIGGRTSFLGMHGMIERRFLGTYCVRNTFFVFRIRNSFYDNFSSFTNKVGKLTVQRNNCNILLQCERSKLRMVRSSYVSNHVSILLSDLKPFSPEKASSNSETFLHTCKLTIRPSTINVGQP